MGGRRASLEAMLSAFGPNFLRHDGAEIREELGDGRFIRLSNRGGRFAVVVTGPLGSDVFDFVDYDDAVQAWLTFPTCHPTPSR